MAVLFGLLAGCATTRPAAPPSADASAVASAPGAECKRPRRRSRFREMTWAEYYTDVRERAWRNAAQVIWITPPKLRKPRPGTTPEATACAR